MATKHANNGDASTSTTEHRAKKLKMSGNKEYPTDSHFYSLLLNTPAKDFYDPNTTIFVAERIDKITDVWKGLVKHNFLSVPVLQKTEKRYFGFLDIADIVKYITEKYSAEETKGSEKFWEQVKQADVFDTLQVNDLMKHPISLRNPFHPIGEQYSLLHAMELLAREPNLHRLPVVDKDRHLINLITQSKLVDFLAKNSHLLGSKANKPLHACKELFKNTIRVSEDATTLEAFNIMVAKGVSGIAVVNDKDELVGNISLRDLKCIANAGHLRQFWRLYMTTKNFILHLKKEFEEAHGRPHVAVYAKETDTIATVLDALATNHVHRLYIVDTESRKAIGLVSLKDILAEILSN